MNERSDEQLIVATGRGDRRSFRALYRRYRDPLYRFLKRRLGDDATAEDVLQETFVGIIRAAPRFEVRAHAKVSTFLYRIAANQASKRSRRRSEEALEEEDRCSSDNPGPEHQASDSERAEAVRLAISRLKAEQRDVLILCHYEGLRYAEVAEILDVPIGTVRSRLSRAKEALRIELRALLSLEGGGK